jgi:hypothetical protein
MADEHTRCGRPVNPPVTWESELPDQRKPSWRNRTRADEAARAERAAETREAAFRPFETAKELVDGELRLASCGSARPRRRGEGVAVVARRRCRLVLLGGALIELFGTVPAARAHNPPALLHSHTAQSSFLWTHASSSCRAWARSANAPPAGLRNPRAAARCGPTPLVAMAVDVDSFIGAVQRFLDTNKCSLWCARLPTQRSAGSPAAAQPAAAALRLPDLHRSRAHRRSTALAPAVASRSSSPAPSPAATRSASEARSCTRSQRPAIRVGPSAAPRHLSDRPFVLPVPCGAQ